MVTMIAPVMPPPDVADAAEHHYQQHGHHLEEGDAVGADIARTHVSPHAARDACVDGADKKSQQLVAAHVYTGLGRRRARRH